MRERVQGLLAQEREYVLSREEHRLRVGIDALILLCGRLAFSDAQMSRVLEAFSGVLRLLTSPGQAMIGSRAEAACLRAFAALERDVANTALDAGEFSLDELSTMADTFRDVPVEVVTGRKGSRASIDMMCWVAASSLSDGVRTPYLTARTLANLGFYKTSDEPSIVSRMGELALRFEDETGERPALSALIHEEATRYLRETTLP